jgi:hypothetical protein
MKLWCGGMLVCSLGGVDYYNTHHANYVILRVRMYYNKRMHTCTCMYARTFYQELSLLSTILHVRYRRA